MLKELMVEYEVFEDIGETVLTVVDREKDEALNMFKAKLPRKYIRCLQAKK